MRSRLLWLAASLSLSILAACAGGDPEPTPWDEEFPVSEHDPLFQDAPNNSDLEEEGKADAVYPATFFELVPANSPVKSQGSRGVCSIFATLALMEHLYIKEGSLPNPDFSEQYLQWSAKVEARGFQNTEGSNADVNLRAISNFGVVAEGDWPYESAPWSTANDAACTGGENLPTKCYTNGEPPQRARDARKWTLPRGRWINSAERSIKAHLHGKKQGVVIGLTFFYQAWNHRRSELPVNSEYWRQGYVLSPNAKDEEVSLAKRAGHAVLLVGWDDNLEVPKVDETGAVVKDADGNPVMEKGFFIFKNSWGAASFGVSNPHGAGYGYLAYSYVRDWGSAMVSDIPRVEIPDEACDSGADEDLDGQIDCDDSDCANAPVCQGGSETRTYSATPGTAIPDNDPTGVSSTISVPDAGTVGSLKVSLDITHTYRGDLKVVLHHGGDSIVLHDQEGSSQDDLRVEIPVTAFDGDGLSGDWRLEVSDLANIDTGTLNSWAIEAVVAN
jgi:hypothetical protein